MKKELRRFLVIFLSPSSRTTENSSVVASFDNSPSEYMFFKYSPIKDFPVLCILLTHLPQGIKLINFQYFVYLYVVEFLLLDVIEVSLFYNRLKDRYIQVQYSE